MPTLTILYGCRTIQLTRGLNTLVDEDSFCSVGRFKWCTVKYRNTFYAARNEYRPGRRSNPIIHHLHRDIMEAATGVLVDHRNGDGLDNRRENLRFASHSQNGGNIHASQGKSRFKGVGVTLKTTPWKARIRVNRKQIHLGCFSTEEEAARAYDEAAKKHFGEFARTNVDIHGPY